MFAHPFLTAVLDDGDDADVATSAGEFCLVLTHGQFFPPTVALIG